MTPQSGSARLWTEESAAIFREGLALDDATWARGRGWALWKAVITLAREKRSGENAKDAARRFGWRVGPREVIGVVVADHRLR
jgi:aminoglycoside phosphotransferase (APT) family kinase protein